MRALAVFLITIWLAATALAAGKTSIIVLPADYPGPKEALAQQLVEAVGGLAPTDRILVYAARPLQQLAVIAVPNDPNAQNRGQAEARGAVCAGPSLYRSPSSGHTRRTSRQPHDSESDG
jgi:hypothetical protein